MAESLETRPSSSSLLEQPREPVVRAERGPLVSAAMTVEVGGILDKSNTTSIPTCTLGRHGEPSGGSGKQDICSSSYGHYQVRWGGSLSVVTLVPRLHDLEAWRVLTNEHEGKGGNRLAALSRATRKMG